MSISRNYDNHFWVYFHQEFTLKSGMDVVPHEGEVEQIWREPSKQAMS